MVGGISYTAEAIYTVIASYLYLFLKPIWVIFLGMSVASISLFCTSFISNHYLFCWIFGTSLGVLSSTIFLPSMWILWSQIPKNKGKTSGILLAGYSFGSVPFGILFTAIVNPYDHSPIETGINKEMIFDQEVAQRVPLTIRWTAVLFFIIGTLGVLLLPKAWKGDLSNKKAAKNLSFYDMIKLDRFWHYFFLMFLGVLNYSYFSNVYKIYALNYIKGDHFITLVGSFTFISAGIGRVVFGILFDKYSWKVINLIAFACIIFIIVTFEYTLINKYLFGIALIVLNFIQASIYPSVLLEFEREFITDKWIFSYVCLAFIFAFGSPYFFEKFITPVIGYSFTFLIVAFITFLDLLLVAFHKRKVIDYIKIED